MNIPTHCSNCDTTEGVKFECRGCKFSRFCSRDCQKKCWKQHKIYCMPLTDAVKYSIEAIRPLLRDKYRVDDVDENLNCMFCLEGATPEDPLFQSGCACRPDSGMSIGHISCFQELARASFADEKKIGFDCRIAYCSHCSQRRNGIILFEMLLTLWKLYDVDILQVQQNIKSTHHAQAFKNTNALKCLDSVLDMANCMFPPSDLFVYTRLRLQFLTMNVQKQVPYPNKICSLLEEFAIDNRIGMNLRDLDNKCQTAIDFSRRYYEKILPLIPEYPMLKRFRALAVNNLAGSLLDAFKESLAYDNPLYSYIDEAERLIREESRENRDHLHTYRSNIGLLCNVLIAQGKYEEAKQIHSPHLEETQRIFGPLSPATKETLRLQEYICFCVDEYS